MRYGQNLVPDIFTGTSKYIFVFQGQRQIFPAEIFVFRPLWPYFDAHTARKRQIFVFANTLVRPILAGGKTDKKATKKQQFVDCFCLRPGRACTILVSVLPIIFVKTKLGFLYKFRKSLQKHVHAPDHSS